MLLYLCSIDICNKSTYGKVMMCPQCDRYCDYVPLSDSCFLSKVTYLFDNCSTIIFSLFMALWGE